MLKLQLRNKSNAEDSEMEISFEITKKKYVIPKKKKRVRKKYVKA